MMSWVVVSLLSGGVMSIILVGLMKCIQHYNTEEKFPINKLINHQNCFVHQLKSLKSINEISSQEKLIYKSKPKITHKRLIVNKTKSQPLGLRSWLLALVKGYYKAKLSPRNGSVVLIFGVGSSLTLPFSSNQTSFLLHSTPSPSGKFSILSTKIPNFVLG